MGIFLTSCKDEFIDHYIENVKYKIGLKFQTQISVTLNFVEEGDEAFFDDVDESVKFFSWQIPNARNIKET